MRKLALLSVLLLAGASAFAEDWPKFQGPRGDGISREKIAASWPEDGLKPVWTATVGKGYATPVAVGDKVYMFALAEGKDVLWALDAATGKVAWQSSVGDAWGVDKKETYAGTRCTPTIEGDFIYTFGGKGDLACRKLADGSVVWHVNVLKDNGATPIMWGCASSPAIFGENICVQVGKGGPLAVMVSKKDGKYVWKSAKAMAGYATVIDAQVGDKTQLIVFGGKALYGLDSATGATLWNEPWETDYDINATMPIYRDGKLFIASGYGKGCGMFEVSATGAKKLWANKSLQGRFPPAILEGDVIFGNSEGTPVCLKWADGSTVWRAKESTFLLGHGGTLLRNGDLLITLSERGKMTLARTSPEGMKKLSQFQAVEGKEVWSSPMIHNGKLYVKGKDELVCYDVSAK